MMIYRSLAAIAGIAIILAAPAESKKRGPEGLELQQMQSREFETTYDVVFPAVVTVLQDAGYRIQGADKNSGLVTGTASTKSGMSYNLFVGFGRSKKTPVVSAFIEARGPRMTRVRVSFVMAKTKSSMYGMTSSDEEPITDAAVYQQAFEKIQKEIFVRQAMDGPPSEISATNGSSSPH
jgi:formylmethanofuran dehydrogenase subunit E-like metal-binding protein